MSTLFLKRFAIEVIPYSVVKSTNDILKLWCIWNITHHSRKWLEYYALFNSRSESQKYDPVGWHIPI